MADILASVSVVLGAEVSQFKSAMANARKELRGLQQAGEAMKDTGAALSKYLTAPLVGLGGISLKIGGDFQSAFNRVEAATQSSGAALESLRKKAQGIALDPNLKFSSVQAAEALEALAKNGLSTAQILGGAADASTNLATATGAQLATAADITTDVMNNFGKSAQQAAGLVSNITGTTIASKFAIDDYRMALGQAGAVAGQLGVSFEDFNTALGVTSSGFSSGSDAGTSFKTFLQRLVPQSKEAEAAINQLGLNFFDAQGKMRPLRDIAGQLQQAFKGLSDQQKNELGTKIFGADSIRTALLLAKEGVAGFDEMAKSIAKVNAASQGEILNKGFVGAFESFKSSLEGLGQAIADNGILDFATSFAKEGAALASNLAQADPAILKFGVTLGAIAAATGPLLVAVGTLGAALPAIEAGFLLLSGPVGIAVAGFAALAVGGAALIASNSKVGQSVEQVGQQFQAQQSAVQELQGTYLPLLARYDELKAKSKLTADEQEELRSIIEKVGAQIPNAITQFDSYGKAMDISTEAGRGFIRQQVLINEQLNKDQLTVQRARYAELTGGIRETEAALALLVKQQKISADGYGALSKRPDFNTKDQQNYQFYLQKTGQEVQALQEKLLNFRNTRIGVGGLIDQLKGIPPAVNEAADAAGKLGDKLGKVAGLNVVGEASSKMGDALAKLRAELAVNDNLSRALGETYDYVGGRSKVLESGIKDLVTVGFAPMGQTVQGLRTDLNGLAVAMDTLATRKFEGFDNLFKTPDFKLVMPEKLELPPVLPMDITGMDLSADGLAAGYDKIKNAIATGAQTLSAADEQVLNSRRDFNTNMEQLTDQLGASIGPALADIAGQFGEAFGSIIAGTATASQAFGQLFGGILSSIGSFMSDFGKKLVALGIGKTALDTLFKGPAGGPLAIAAGLGLIALGGIASALGQSANSSMASIGSGGGGGISTSVPSTPRSYTPTVAPPAATQQTRVVHEVVMMQRGSDLVGVVEIAVDRLGRVNGTRRNPW